MNKLLCPACGENTFTRRSKFAIYFGCCTCFPCGTAVYLDHHNGRFNTAIFAGVATGIAPLIVVSAGGYLGGFWTAAFIVAALAGLVAWVLEVSSSSIILSRHRSWFSRKG